MVLVVVRSELGREEDEDEWIKDGASVQRG